MSDFRTQEAASSAARAFTLVARASGNPITSGTVNWYLKNITGANASKWWRDSDQTWQVAETANAMTHQADGHWTRTLAATPWNSGDVSLEYAKESGDLHVPISRLLYVEYTPSANSSRQISGGLYGEDGSVTFTYTLYDTNGTTPLVGATVWVTSDVTGTYRSQTKTTDNLGRVSFDLDPGTVYIWRYHPQRTFTNPDTEIIV